MNLAHPLFSSRLRFHSVLLAALLLLVPRANAQNWVLVWSDEFNGPAGPFTPTSPDNQWWTFETGHGIFGTGEIEFMVDDGTTSFLDGNGNLVIKTYQWRTTVPSRTKSSGPFMGSVTPMPVLVDTLTPTHRSFRIFTFTA